MLERLIEILGHVWEHLLPFEVVNAYEGGVILRFGKYRRTIGPGINWKWPLAERALTANTCVTTMRLPAQSLIDATGRDVVVSAIVRYQIRDAKPFLLDIWDSRDVLGDTVAGALKTAVSRHPLASANAALIEAEALEQTRKNVNKYGFQIHAITLVDYSAAPTMRLIQLKTMMPTDN